MNGTNYERTLAPVRMRTASQESYVEQREAQAIRRQERRAAKRAKSGERREIVRQREATDERRDALADY